MRKALLVLLLSFNVFGKPLPGPQNDVWKDLGSAVRYAGHGSYMQFQSKTSYAYLGTGSVFLSHAFAEDDDLLQKFAKKKKSSFLDALDFAGVVGSSPLWPVGLYVYGRTSSNEHLIRFTMESSAAVLLAQIETVSLSLIDIHERPDDSDLSFWETQFRGDSSFPSGHVIPWFVLGFKAYQFYGPWVSTLPFALSLAVSYERVQSARHYWSDIVGSFIISAMASEGVRKAASYDKNHSAYKDHLENDLSWLPIFTHSTKGLLVTLNY
jgi:hypothetical protein